MVSKPTPTHTQMETKGSRPDLPGSRLINISKSDETKENLKAAIALDKVIPPDSPTSPNQATIRKITSGAIPSKLTPCRTQIERMSSISDLPGSMQRTRTPYKGIVKPTLPKQSTPYTNIPQQVNRSKSAFLNAKRENRALHQKASKLAMPGPTNCKMETLGANTNKLTAPHTQQQVKNSRTNLLRSVGTPRKEFPNSAALCWSRSPSVTSKIEASTKNIPIPYVSIPQQVNWPKSDCLKGKWKNETHQVSKLATSGPANSKGSIFGKKMGQLTISNASQQVGNSRFDLPRSTGTSNDDAVKGITVSPRRIDLVVPGSLSRKMALSNTAQQMMNSKVDRSQKSETLYNELVNRYSVSPKVFITDVPRTKSTQLASSSTRQQVKNSASDRPRNNWTPHYEHINCVNLSPTKIEVVVPGLKSRQLSVPNILQQVKNSSFGQLWSTRTPQSEVVNRAFLSPTRIKCAMPNKLTTPNKRQKVQNSRSNISQITGTPYNTVIKRVTLSPTRIREAFPDAMTRKLTGSTDSTRQQVNYQNFDMFKAIRKNGTSHQGVSKPARPSPSTSFVPTLQSKTGKQAALHVQKQLESSNLYEHLPRISAPRAIGKVTTSMNTVHSDAKKQEPNQP